MLIATYLLEEKTGPLIWPVEVVKSFFPSITYAIVFASLVRLTVEVPYGIPATWVGFAAVIALSVKLWLGEGKRHFLAIDLKTASLVGKDLSLLFQENRRPEAP